MIFDVFDTAQQDLATKLELPPSQVQSIFVSSIRPLDPTTAPSKSPTDLPSTSPTTSRPSIAPTPEPTPNPTREEKPAPAPIDANCEDISSYFEGGEYDEYVGGDHEYYTIRCDDLIGTNVIGFSLVGDCGFTCVADKKPPDFEPKCGGAPPGTTVQVQLKGDFEGERILIGIQADGVPKLPCENPFLVEGQDF